MPQARRTRSGGEGGKENDPRYRYFPELRGEEFTSMASVPMGSRPSGLVGVLTVHTRSRLIFTERHVVLLTTIGSLVAGAVHQARLHRRLAAREHAHERFAERVLARRMIDLTLPEARAAMCAPGPAVALPSKPASPAVLRLRPAPGEECAQMSQPTAGPRVGFVGVGRMGLPMCANLARAGHDVTAWDVREELRDAVTGCGVRWGGSAASVAAAADVLITMLPGGPEVRDLMLAPGGVLAALPATATWIDMTSTAPVIGRELAGAARARGVGMLDAPAGGGVRAAVAGSLQLFVGGDAGLLERYRALLGALADPGRIVRMGGPGTGYTTKHLVNLLWFGQAVATAEALLLARREGIDLPLMQRTLAGSAASSSFIRHDLGALFGGDYLTSFGLDRCCQELSAITALAREDGVPFELSELVEGIYRRALARYGPVDGELLPVAMLEELAGVQLRDRD